MFIRNSWWADSLDFSKVYRDRVLGAKEASLTLLLVLHHVSLQVYYVPSLIFLMQTIF